MVLLVQFLIQDILQVVEGVDGIIVVLSLIVPLHLVVLEEVVKVQVKVVILYQQHHKMEQLILVVEQVVEGILLVDMVVDLV
tara:strand:- start:51 stop:296 length:246 start_codon:yes stop_codon:yes gene_type:complete